MTDFRSRADEALAGAYEEPMSLSEYVDRALERPTVAAHAAKYLLDAIEAQGTRTVVEEGEERERYRFFDDPHNDGEHAILGNTAVLNAFVDDLRTVAAGRGKAEKMFWFDGPTATGKSELKRCLVNGLREYSKTPAGRRYTLEWNVEGVDEDDRSLSYGDSYEDEDDWYESPVQTHPLSVFPEEVRERLLTELNGASDDHVPITLDADLDPFSREAYDYLMSAYRREGRPDPFSAATDSSHLRVTNYVVDIGRGIGVLHAEDDGSPKERLVGSWMPGMLQELDSRGRKNPQAFSYDGVLSQGNGLLTVVEDAAQHADLLRKLLNVPDEGRVKLDKGIGMDVDTLLVVISNPDLDAELDQFADRDAADPLKALKRRLDKHRFRYLTEVSLEAQLVRRELTDETPVWTGDADDIEARVRESLSMSVRDDRGDVGERELAPHTVAAAALYSVVTRLDGDGLPPELSLVEKAQLYDRGFIRDGDERREADAFDLDGEDDGARGIPVTYTRDAIADLLHETPDRVHPELAVESVVMPDDVLDAMANGLTAAPVFSRSEAAEYENRVAGVKEEVFARQEEDVLDAILAEKTVEEETVAEYVEHVFAWSEDETVDTERGPVDPDPLLMKVFETEHLGRFGDADYRGNEPRSQVVEFRTEQVITALNRYAWQNRDEGFEIDDVDLSEIPVIRSVLDTHSWSDVRRLFEDFEPDQWSDPPANTETERVKEQTIEELCEQGYSPASAELTSRKVLREVSHRWD
ncbi:MAG: PrkA family serine protein kinase [Halolamina sp.]